MIGNAHPLEGSDCLAVEVGEIDPQSFQLVVHHYQLVDRYGRCLADGFTDLAAVRRYVADTAQKKLTGHGEAVK